MPAQVREFRSRSLGAVAAKRRSPPSGGDRRFSRSSASFFVPRTVPPRRGGTPSTGRAAGRRRVTAFSRGRARASPRSVLAWLAPARVTFFRAGRATGRRWRFAGSLVAVGGRALCTALTVRGWPRAPGWLAVPAAPRGHRGLPGPARTGRTWTTPGRRRRGAGRRLLVVLVRSTAV